MNTRLVSRDLLTLAILFSAVHAWGWGAPHGTITQAALKTLPAWQQETLGNELKPLGALYCIIPDLVYTRKDLAPYATMASHPGVVYLVNLHLPASPSENYDLLRTFMGKAVIALQTNNVAEAARYAGTLAHMLEDWGCPAHSVPNDNMFTLFKQFLPPPDAYRYAPLHGPIENGTFSVDVGDYRPRLLGTSVDEAAFNLLQRSQEATVHARGQVIPIIQALYAGDTNAWNAAQQKAALVDAALVSDALYTLVSIGRAHMEPAEAAACQTTDLSAFAPLEAPNLYLPQTAFFSKPYWGHATRGVILNGGTNAVPLRLSVTENGKQNVRTFESGIGTGTGRSLSYLIPADVYQRFTAQVGLHAEMGATGNVIFEVFGNGRSLVRIGPITGGMPAQAVDVTLAGVTNLQLSAASAGGDGTGNYAVWAEPRLVKPSISGQTRADVSR